MKRSITLILVIAMLAVLVVPTSAAVFTDTAGHKCEEAAMVLSSLGIVEGKSEGVFEPDSSLTRAEMATILIRTMGMAEGISGKDIFSDVPSSHWAYAYVTAAYQLGIVNGMDSQTFAPDTPLTYEQAVKMVVSTLGYTVQAESLGGYPTGYLSKASQLGILKGTSAEGASISRGTMAVLLYNSLDAPLLQRDSYGTDKGTYSKGEDTLLSKYLKIKKVTGILSANYFTTISAPDRAVRRGEVALGTDVYDAGTTGADEMIGRKVTIYAKDYDDSSVPAILAVVPASASKVASVSANDITGNTTKTRLAYEEEGKSKDSYYDIQGNATLVLNGKVKAGWTADDLLLDSGYVKLIMNDGATADYVIVESYENYIVNSVNADDLTVYFKEGGNMVIDPANKAVKTSFINAEGTDVTVEELAEWDVLSVSASEDGQVRKIVQSTSSVTGTLTEYGERDVSIKDDTEEKSYDVAHNMLSTSLTKITSDLVGKEAAFYLDYMGNIAAVNTEFERNYSYGYLVGAANTKGMDPKAQFKIFTEQGEMKLFDGADKITVNGTKLNNSVAIENIPLRNKYQTPVGTTAYSKSGSTIQQLIRYKTNGAETPLITEIETSTDRTPDPDTYRGDTGFNKVFELDKDRKSVTYNSANDTMAITGGSITFVASTVSTFGARFAMRDSTVIFVVPAEGDDDKKFSIKKKNTLSHGTDGEVYNYISLYDINDTYTVGAMVWDQGAAGGSNAAFAYPSYSTPCAIVTDITKGINADGEVTSILNIYNWSGKEIKLYGEADYEVGYSLVNTNLTDDPYGEALTMGAANNATGRSSVNKKITLKELKPGDVIQYEATADGTPTLISVIFRAGTPGMFEWTINSARVALTTKDVVYQGGSLVSNGWIIDADANSIITKVHPSSYLGVPNTSTFLYRAMPTAGQMLLFDMEKETYRKITYEDLLPDDVYLSVWRTNSQMFFIVYR